MRKLILVVALWLPIACATNTQRSPEGVTDVGATGPLAELVWLSGSWASMANGHSSEEHWTAPSANLMLGMNRSVDSGVTTHHEQLRIELRDDGVFYIASPSRQETTAFKLVDSGEAHAVFENREHDYPKRITYRRSGSTLTVRIEGNPGERVAEWHWQRGSLPGD